MEIKVVEKFGKLLSGISMADDFFNYFINLLKENKDTTVYTIDLSDIIFIDHYFASNALAKIIKLESIIVYFKNVSFLNKRTLDNTFMEQDIFSIVEDDGSIEFIGNFSINLKEVVDILSNNEIFTLNELSSEMGIEKTICKNRINKLVDIGYVKNNRDKYQLSLAE